jgi:hypothetical protein
MCLALRHLLKNGLCKSNNVFGGRKLAQYGELRLGIFSGHEIQFLKHALAELCRQAGRIPAAAVVRSVGRTI